MDKLSGLDLFSGIGGISRALEPWVQTIAYCEQDKYAQGVLMSRMRQGLLDEAPIWDDVRSLRGSFFQTQIDIIFGGFPCQDISVAGHGKGLAGERSGLFSEIVRLVQEIKPTFIFLENVPAIRTRGLKTVVGELTDLGYDCRWTCISAEWVGAPHLRKRWFLLAAHSQRVNLRDFKQWRSGGRAGPVCNERENVVGDDGAKEFVADAKGLGHARRGQGISAAETSGGSRMLSCGSGEIDRGLREDWWAIEPHVRRVVNELPYRVDRIRCLGNAVVPAQARKAFEILIGG